MADTYKQLREALCADVRETVAALRREIDRLERSVLAFDACAALRERASLGGLSVDAVCPGDWPAGSAQCSCGWPRT